MFEDNIQTSFDNSHSKSKTKSPLSQTKQDADGPINILNESGIVKQDIGTIIEEKVIDEFSSVNS